ncbi:MAG: hypothetical protein LBT25_10925 [Candidatus Symbiothrix sp.]|jgi:hypothetical protein|nr:hypothetical protein [Candidatus Symbiothrix sp.]
MAFLIFLSCSLSYKKEKDEHYTSAALEYKIQKSITGVVEAFSYYLELPPADAYELVWDPFIEEKDIKLYYYFVKDSLIESIWEYGGIVTIVNAKNQIYSIPLFSNAISNYWNFEFLEPDPNLPHCHTTFEKEFLTAMDSLQLNDTQHSDSVVFDKIMFSLLHCKQFEESDSISLTTKNWDIRDCCRELLNKNFAAILKGIYSDKQHLYCNAFEDIFNERIFQIDYGKKNKDYLQRKKKMKISIKVYRLDCRNIIPPC